MAVLPLALLAGMLGGAATVAATVAWLLRHPPRPIYYEDR